MVTAKEERGGKRGGNLMNLPDLLPVFRGISHLLLYIETRAN